MSVWIVIAFIAGLILGLLIAWFYWRQRISEHEAQIHSLQALVNQQDQRLQITQASLQEETISAERLRDQVSQGEETLRDLTAQLKDRDQTISQLKAMVSVRDAEIEDWQWRAEEADARAGGQVASLQE